MNKKNYNYLNEIFSEYNKNIDKKNEIEKNGISTLEEETRENITYDDWWGNSYASAIGTVEGGVYFYYLNTKIIDQIMVTNKEKRLRQMCMIPPVEAIQSVNYNPYLRGEDISAQLITFDKERMPIPTDTGQFIIPPYLPRIKKLTVEKKLIGAFYRYKKNPNHTSRHYENESKLQFYPYTYGILADGFSTPIEFRYEFIETGSNIAQVYLYQKLTNQATYFMSIENYKGDKIGTLEGSFSNATPNLPIVSNAYVNFMSSNQAQNKMQIVNGALNGVKSTVMSGVKFASGDIIGGASGLADSAISSSMQIGNAMAQRTDAKTTPNTMKDTGGDILLKSFVNNGYFSHYRMDITETYKIMLGDYFAMYGYKQNRVMKPDVNSRHYYNYIKTINVNIDGQGIPREHYDKLCNIYNRGTTIWHADNDEVIIGDYSKDNKEVELY